LREISLSFDHGDDDMHMVMEAANGDLDLEVSL